MASSLFGTPFISIPGVLAPMTSTGPGTAYPKVWNEQDMRVFEFTAKTLQLTYSGSITVLDEDGTPQDYPFSGEATETPDTVSDWLGLCVIPLLLGQNAGRSFSVDASDSSQTVQLSPFLGGPTSLHVAAICSLSPDLWKTNDGNYTKTISTLMQVTTVALTLGQVAFGTGSGSANILGQNVPYTTSFTAPATAFTLSSFVLSVVDTIPGPPLF